MRFNLQTVSLAGLLWAGCSDEPLPPPPAEAQQQEVRHAAHFDPAAENLPPLSPLAARLPGSSEDTGRYNAIKPKLPPLPPAPPPAADPELAQRQQRFLEVWQRHLEQHAGELPEERDAAHQRLKRAALGE